MRSRRAMSATARAMPTACDSLSITHGPAMSSRDPSPRTTSGVIEMPGTAHYRWHQPPCREPTPASGSLPAPIADGGHVRGDALQRHLATIGRFDETGKQRMRPQRLRSELGMELHGYEPG